MTGKAVQFIEAFIRTGDPKAAGASVPGWPQDRSLPIAQQVVDASLESGRFDVMMLAYHHGI